MFFGIIIVGLVIYFLLKGQNTNGYTTSSPSVGANNEALQIAKNRFAKGEITTEEFETIKKSLS